jgi:hypothetical protein
MYNSIFGGTAIAPGGERIGYLMVSIYGPAAAGDVGCHLCFALLAPID